MRALGLAMALALGTTGCAFLDGVGGGDGDDVGGVCDFATVSVDSPATGSISSVMVTLLVTHSRATEVSGYVEHAGTYGQISLSTSGAESFSFGEFDGLDASGTWTIALVDYTAGDDGTWDGLQLDVCGDSCESAGTSALPLNIPDCSGF